MYPIIFQYKGLVISSYGLMLMLAFITCNYLLKQYLLQNNKDPKIGDDIIFYAAIGGIIGAKLYYIIEGIPTGDAKYNIDGLVLIITGIFSLSFEQLAQGINQFGSGLVFLGGLIGGMLSVTIYIRKNNLDWLTVGDWVAPFLALGHAIGRIGCFLVGDCYGIPSDLPWACAFPNGLPPTFNPVHPTQIYEMTAYFAIFTYLRFAVKKNQQYSGQIIFEYLFLAGFARFVVEFIRLNPTYLFGLSGAQFI